MDSSQPSETTPGNLPSNRSVAADTELRASDADRERTTAVLQAATADGRVSSDELEKRLDLVYSAKSKGELASIVKDLQPMRWAGSSPTATKDVGIINSIVRKGRWVVGEKYRATAIISTGVIDLREAQFIGPETTIQVRSWISTVYVIVPENVEVRVSGAGIIGGFKQDREGLDHAATHLINVTGHAVCGSVLVVHSLPESEQRRLMK